MIIVEHRRPFAAFVLVFAAACLILGQGLRTQVVDVIIGSVGRPELSAGVAPDMVLGQSLELAPRATQPPRATRPRVALSTSGATAGQGVSRVGSSTESVLQVSTSGARPRTSSAHPAGTVKGPADHSTPTAPAVSPATPGPPAVPVPGPTPVPGSAKPALAPVPGPDLRPVLRPALGPVRGLTRTAGDNRPGDPGLSRHHHFRERDTQLGPQVGRSRHHAVPGPGVVPEVVATRDRSSDRGRDGRPGHHRH